MRSAIPDKLTFYGIVEGDISDLMAKTVQLACGSLDPGASSRRGRFGAPECAFSANDRLKRIEN